MKKALLVMRKPNVMMLALGVIMTFVGFFTLYYTTQLCKVHVSQTPAPQAMEQMPMNPQVVYERMVPVQQQQQQQYQQVAYPVYPEAKATRYPTFQDNESAKMANIKQKFAYTEKFKRLFSHALQQIDYSDIPGLMHYLDGMLVGRIEATRLSQKGTEAFDIIREAKSKFGAPGSQPANEPAAEFIEWAMYQVKKLQARSAY